MINKTYSERRSCLG